MSKKRTRIAVLATTVAAVGAMTVAATPASAAFVVDLEEPMKNWVVSGELTPKKLNQPVTLPEGSTFNGRANVALEIKPGEAPFATGTVTGGVFVPPFNTTLLLAGLAPTAVGVTFTQVGTTEGTLVTAPEVECAGSKGVSGSKGCVTLGVPTKAELGITEVGLLGINTPVHCETSEPVTFPLSAHVTLVELLHEGPHFAGTVTIPPMTCEGLTGIAVAPLLTTLMSGPDNPYTLSITPPQA
jgi:hypothetical protein